MVGDNKVLTVRCSWNGISSVPVEFQTSDNSVGNRCGSHGVCRVKATSTVVHLNDHTCECEWIRAQVNSKSCGVSVAIDNADHEFSNAIKFEETVIYECHVQRLQSQLRDG